MLNAFIPQPLKNWHFLILFYVLYHVNRGSNGGLPINGQREFCVEASREVILYKTLKVKREADKVKAVYSLGSGYQVQVVADLLDLDEQTVR